MGAHDAAVPSQADAIASAGSSVMDESFLTFVEMLGSKLAATGRMQVRVAQLMQDCHSHLTLGKPVEVEDALNAVILS
jgi:hypothetical protein